ncbi:MAG: rod shape-determining protein RodA [Muribaculaceae bacterium]|nr:rod shape-determining protein RodA [Muribaculaceae bacterium]
MDWFTIILYLLLVVAGAVSIYAATYDFDKASMFDMAEFSGKQFVWAGLSIIIGFSLLLIDRRLYEAYAYPIYGVMIMLLIVTIFVAPDIKGSHSWLVFGPVSLQPAEFAKFATALALAKLFGTYGFQLNSARNYAIAITIIVLPILCIILERETGSALVYTSLVFVLYREGMSGFVLFAALCAIVYFVVVLKFAAMTIMGIPLGMFVAFIIVMVLIVAMLLFYCRSFFLWRNVTLGYVVSGLLAWALIRWAGVSINGYVFFGVVIGVSLIYLAWGMLHDDMRKVAFTLVFAVLSIIFMFMVNFAFNNILEPHQQMRIKVTLGIEQDLRGAGYNVNQSKIAIGSGGLLGKGFLNGTQTKLKYVPEQHTDFIFCTIGEEKGFVGSVIVLVAFLTLILRIITLAERQQTTFGRVYAYCVASYLIFHLAINIGMVIGLCPVIGIPLPFFSYGGSSLWGFTFLLFILLRIDADRRAYGSW